jgi:hypothetical protein
MAVMYVYNSDELSEALRRSILILFWQKSKQISQLVFPHKFLQQMVRPFKPLVQTKARHFCRECQ